MKILLTLIIILCSISANGQTAQEFYNNGNEKANSQDFSGSIKDFDNAINLDPKYVDAYYNRATSKIYLKDYEGAIDDYDKSIELKADFVNAYTNRGVAKLYMNEYNGSIIDFNSAIKLDPNNVLAYFLRGQAKLQSDDTDGGCEDFKKAKDLGEKRADRFLELYCETESEKTNQNKTIESLMIDWPDEEGWKIANQQNMAEENMIELLRNEETFDNWTEIGTMFVYKKINAEMNIPITKTMDIIYDKAMKNCPTAILTMIEKDEKTRYPWIIFKIECSSNASESQVWYAIQGTNELFLNFRAVKQKTVPVNLQDKWVSFFKSAKIVTH